MGPVSYTHLDVYKRQRHNSSSRNNDINTQSEYVKYSFTIHPYIVYVNTAYYTTHSQTILVVENDVVERNQAILKALNICKY